MHCTATALLTLLVAATSANAYWDYMLFEQQWAPGVCQSSNATVGLGRHHHHGGSTSCVIPSSTSDGFTIHGSWPTKVGTEGPNFCNNSWPFEQAPINDLISEMDVFWPSFYGPNAAFWSHEWVKHGVCAATMSLLDSEHKYFGFVLNLRKKNDFKAMFADQHIVPSSDQPYSHDVMSKAIQTSLGVRPVLGCKLSEGKQYLSELAICVSRDLQIIECDETVFAENKHCSTEMSIFYLPHRHSS